MLARFFLTLGIPIALAGALVGDDWPFVPLENSTLRPPSRIGILVVQRAPKGKAAKAPSPAYLATRERIRHLVETSLADQLQARGFTPVVLSTSGPEYEPKAALEPVVLEANKGKDVAATIAIIVHIFDGLLVSGRSYRGNAQPFLHIGLQPELVAPDGRVLGRPISGGCYATEAFFTDFWNYRMKDPKQVGEELGDCLVTVFGLSAVGVQAVETGDNPFLGKWRLRPEASQFQDGPAPASETCLIAADGNGMNFASDTVSAKGKPNHSAFRLEPDGKEHSGRGATSMRALRGKDFLEAVMSGKEAMVVFHKVWRLSPDGKTMTLTQHDKGPNYTTYTNVLVYERQ